jgi:large subunit ribosomal protein L21
MFAVVEIAGFQEKVSKGDKIKVPTLGAEAGKSMTFDKVLMVGEGDSVKIGAPHLSGASVEVKVLSHGQGDKIRVVKAHRRKRYRRVKGHRQGFTEVEVVSIKA